MSYQQCEFTDEIRNIKITRAGERAKNEVYSYLIENFAARVQEEEFLRRVLDNVNHIRHIRSRGDYDNTAKRIRIDIKCTHINCEYSLSPTGLVHEMTHAFENGCKYKISKKAKRGRNNKAHYYNQGFPHFDFGGKHPRARNYMLDNTYHCPGRDEAVEILEEKMNAIDEHGLQEENGVKYPPIVREHPTDVDTGEETPEELFRNLFKEANIAWYVTARLMEEGYDEAARHSIVGSNYSATNASEMLCMSSEQVSAVSRSPSTPKLAKRHPWLFKYWTDIIQPSKQARKELLDHNIICSEY